VAVTREISGRVISETLSSVPGCGIVLGHWGTMVVCINKGSFLAMANLSGRNKTVREKNTYCIEIVTI
jgi:hypothetical protein